MTTTPVATPDEAILRIPKAMARRYARAARRAGTDEAEVEAVAGLALAKALAAFDPAMGQDASESRLAPFCFQRVEWAARNEVWPRPKRKSERARRLAYRRQVPLDPLVAAGRHGEKESLVVLGRPDPALGRLESAEECERLLGLLTPIERCVVVLASLGYSQVEAARLLGVSRTAAYDAKKRARWKAEAFARREEQQEKEDEEGSDEK